MFFACSARLAEAERIVNEAAREKELRQEEAMLRGGGKRDAERVSVERSAGQGSAPDAESVGAKTETVGPAVEGQFDWKQGAEAAENPVEKYAQLRYHEDGIVVVAEATEGKRHQGVYQDAVKKDERTLRKSIFSRIAQVELHSEKMAHPEAFDSMWQEKEECQKKGSLRTWEKDMIETQNRQV